MRLQPVDSLLLTRSSLVEYFLFDIRLVHGMTCIFPGLLILALWQTDRPIALQSYLTVLMFQRLMQKGFFLQNAIIPGATENGQRLAEYLAKSQDIRSGVSELINDRIGRMPNARPALTSRHNCSTSSPTVCPVVPHAPYATATKAADILFEEAVKEYTARHRVKPGITGLAQINGYRGETDTLEKIEKRVEFDLEYIENWSVWFDLYILFRTAPAVLFTREAY